MTSAPGVQYGYDGQNKRNYKIGGNAEEFYFYGTDGKKIGTYYLQAIPVISNFNMTLTFTLMNPQTYATGPPPLVYFRGRVLAAQDRLGSIGKYYSYGEDKGTGNGGNDALKFATYTRDAATGLDYADQRYYASQFGRFMSADPSGGSGGLRNSVGWNQYAYANDNPANFNDPNGLFIASSDACLAIAFGVGTSWEELDCQMQSDGGYYPSPCPVGNGFQNTRFPSPFCTVPVAAPPPAAASSECFLTVQYRPIRRDSSTPASGILEFFNHTYVTVEDRFLQIQVLEGLPQSDGPPFGDLQSHVFSVQADSFGLMVIGDEVDRPLTDHIQGGVDIRNVFACSLVDSLVYDTRNFDRLTGGTHPYLGITSNSNSFLSWLLAYNGLNFGQPPQTPGWNYFKP